MRVRVVAGGMSQIREISGGSGLDSQNSLTAEFGLGAAVIADTVEVLWSSGVVDRLFGVAVDQRFTLTETPPWAVITAVADVPADQGGWVDLTFQRSGFDLGAETATPINVYNVHRRVDNTALAAEILADGERVTPGTRVVLPNEGGVARNLAGASGPGNDGTRDHEVAWTIPEGNAQKVLRLAGRYYIVQEHSAPPGLWEFVASVAAQQNDNYTTAVPTPADSSGAGPAFTAYFVAAHTSTPSVFYDSPANSGYSVDNLAPAAPQNVAVAYNTGSGNQLSWDPAPEPDFQYYNVYRGNEPGFVHGPGNLVHSTASPAWTDPDYDDVTASYKVTALDHAGNESDAGSNGPATGVKGPNAPRVDALYQNVPNPFNPSTSIRYSLRSASTVTVVVFDAAGRRVRTLLDATMPAGVHDITWDGYDHTGNRVASGVYFYRLEAGAFTQTRKMVLLK